MKKLVNKNDEKIGDLASDKSFQILKLAIEEIKEKYNLSSNEILSLAEEKPVSKEVLVPVSVFENEELSALESICKYLKEELEFNFAKIALLLNRNHRTIWTTYSNAIGKVKGRLRTFKTSYLAGERTKTALYRENNCIFRFAISLKSWAKEFAKSLRACGATDSTTGFGPVNRGSNPRGSAFMEVRFLLSS